MFLLTYKTTLKNLFRSLLFWLMLALLLGFALNRAIEGGNGSYSQQYKEMIYDTDPRYVLQRHTYVQNLDNDCGNTMLHMVPLFLIVSTFLILNRDYGDGFYEIERAGGRKPLCYVGGRLAALFSVGILAMLLVQCVCCYVYVFTRGGVAGFTTGEFIADSAVRILRTWVCTNWPPIAMFICFTYAVGTLLKNAWAAGAVGSVYVMINYVFNYQLRFRIPEWYRTYLTPRPSMIRAYFKHYDYYVTQAEFESWLAQQGCSLDKVMICYGLIVGVTLIYSLVSYLRVRQREI